MTRRPFVSSKAVAALERAWTAIRARNADCPAVVVVIASGVEGHRVARWGSFGASRWRTSSEADVQNGRRGAPSGAVSLRPVAEDVGEVFIAGERMYDGAEGVLETLLHEAAHAIAHARGTKECSRQGRYHNEEFKAIAEDLGLTVEKDRSNGWNVTLLQARTLHDYAEQLVDLREVLSAYRRADGVNDRAPVDEDLEQGDEGDVDEGDVDEEPAPTAGRQLLYLCACEEPRRIRMSLKAADTGPIVCLVCRATFARDGDDPAVACDAVPLLACLVEVDVDADG